MNVNNQNNEYILKPDEIFKSDLEKLTAIEQTDKIHLEYDNSEITVYKWVLRGITFDGQEDDSLPGVIYNIGVRKGASDLLALLSI